MRYRTMTRKNARTLHTSISRMVRASEKAERHAQARTERSVIRKLDNELAKGENVVVLGLTSPQFDACRTASIFGYRPHTFRNRN